MKVKNYPFNVYRLYGDVSGTIKGGDISVGTILFNERYRKGFLETFYSEFPNLKSFVRKAATLNHEKLEDIIAFMDSKRVHMTCIPLGANTIYTQKGYIGDEVRRIIGREPIFKDFHEKILSILYYYALKHKAYKKYVYDGQLCIESQIKIDKVLSKLNSLSNRDGFMFNLSINHRRNQHMLKFADIVASAGRRLDKFFLNGLTYFNLLDCKLEKEDVRHVFALNKLEYDAEQRKKAFKAM